MTAGFYDFMMIRIIARGLNPRGWPKLGDLMSPTAPCRSRSRKPYIAKLIPWLLSRTRLIYASIYYINHRPILDTRPLLSIEHLRGIPRESRSADVGRIWSSVTTPRMFLPVLSYIKDTWYARCACLYLWLMRLCQLRVIGSHVAR